MKLFPPYELNIFLNLRVSVAFIRLEEDYYIIVVFSIELNITYNDTDRHGTFGNIPGPTSINLVT